MRELKLIPNYEKLLTDRRTPHGVRELKPPWLSQLGVPRRRTPHGVRELKLVDSYRKG